MLKTSLLLSLQPKSNKSKNEISILWQAKNEKGVFHHHLGKNFLILSAIAKHSPDIISGELLAHTLNLLTTHEKEEGGPYRRNPESNQIDFDSNVMIAYFLSLQNVELPNLTNLIEEKIASSNFEGEIFPSNFFIPYFITTFYQGKEKKKLAEFFLCADPKNQTDILLCQAGLKNLGQKNYLNKIKLKKIKPNNKIESTLLKIIKHKKNQLEKPGEKEETSEIEKIKKANQERLLGLESKFRTLAEQRINQVIDKNTDRQMSLMAFYTKKALGKEGQKISNSLITELGLMNTYFWTAFIIYDDFWDEDEAAEPRLLPLANFYARHYTKFFSTLFPEKKEFEYFFTSLMDKLDAANAWEISNCRTKVEGDNFFVPKKLPNFEDYTIKYQPASGHILGSIAIFFQLGYQLKSPEIKNLINYFKNYLIAMQINDDAHDWEEDMARGHLSTVVALLLKEYENRYPDQKIIDLKKDKAKLQQIFWYQTIEKAGNKAVSFANKSQKALDKISIIKDQTPLKYYAKLTKNVAKKACKEQKDSIKFLQTFNS